MKNKLKYIVSPNNIAIIGASSNLQKSAGRILVNLLKTSYSGEIFLVNPKHTDILGYKSYSSIQDIESNIDLACIITPAITIPEILKSCIAKKVKAVMILSGGFSENGPEGGLLEQEIKRITEEADIIVYGPNSPGFFNYKKQWGISFSPNFEPKLFCAGNIGLVSQGGTLARAILDGNEKGVNFSYWLSPGNEADIDLNDCLEFLINDQDTEIILLVIESHFEEQRFFNLIHQAFEKNKPIIVLSIGKSLESLPAMRFYLGKEIKVPFPWEAINHPGILKVNSVAEMVQLAWLFSHYNNKSGDRTIIYSWAGGSSIYLADLCARFQVDLPALSDRLTSKLKKIIKIKDYFINPLDITTAVYEDISILTNSLREIFYSNEFDYIVVVFPFRVDYYNEVLAKELVSLIGENRGKIFIPIFLSQGYKSELSLEIIQQSQIPYFLNEYTAIKTLSMFINYRREN